MAGVRLFLYAIAAFSSFAVAVSLIRLEPMLAKLFAVSMFSSALASMLTMVLLLSKVGVITVSTLTSEILWTTAAAVDAIAHVALWALINNSRRGND